MNDYWFTIQKINEVTYAISEYGHWEKVHSFLLIGSKKAALIDTGLGIASIKKITDQLTALPIDVLTTHVHTDHIGNHGEFSSIFVHPDDKDWLEQGISGRTIEQIRRDLVRDMTKPMPESFDSESFFPFQGSPTGLLHDGDMVELGDRNLKIYHTPGHSPGHISILDETYRFLFTGDLLYDTTPIYAFYPSTSPTDLVTSLEKIAAIPNVKKIFGSHNTLGLPPNIFVEVKKATTYLKENDLVKFGTGIHKFEGFSIQF